MSEQANIVVETILDICDYGKVDYEISNTQGLW